MNTTASTQPDTSTQRIFPAIDKNGATRLLRELDWGEHFIGIEMNPAAGNRDVYLYSLKEAVQFLRSGTAGMGLSTGGKGSISWLDVDRFTFWIRDVVQDVPLAEKIDAALQDAHTYHDQIQSIAYLLNDRYTQLIDATS